MRCLLEAIYPGPPVPIHSTSLATKTTAAAQKYGISPTLLQYDRSLFSRDNIRLDPFGTCVLAWNAGQWPYLELASRYTHRLRLEGLLPRAMETVGGPEVLASLMAMTLERRTRIDAVVGRLPGDLICSACRLKNRNAYAPLLEAITQLFQSPFPDIASVFDDVDALATPFLLRGCVSKNCLKSVREYTFSDRQISSLKEALAAVPQTMLEDVIALSSDRHRSSLIQTWRREQATA